jgi:hypothetical protein
VAPGGSTFGSDPLGTGREQFDRIINCDFPWVTAFWKARIELTVRDVWTIPTIAYYYR